MTRDFMHINSDISDVFANRIGCLLSYNSAEWHKRPPTQMMPSESMNGLGGAIGFDVM